MPQTVRPTPAVTSSLGAAYEHQHGHRPRAFRLPRREDSTMTGIELIIVVLLLLLAFMFVALALIE